MSLQGDLSTMGLDDLLQWVGRRQQRGSISARAGDQERTFRLDGERIIAAGSSCVDDHLGAVLVDQGLIRPADLERAYAVQAETRVLLGKILLMIEAIDSATLMAAIEDKIIDAVADVLSWPTGTFVFEPGQARPSASELSVGVGIDDCVARARSRAIAWRSVRAVLPTLDVHLWVVDASRSGGGEASAIINLVNDGLSPRQIAKHLRRPRLPVALDLVGLIDAGAIAVERRARSRRVTDSPPTLSDLEKAAMGRASGGDLLGALEIATMALALHKGDASAFELHRGALTRAASEVAVELLSRVRVPRLRVDRETLPSLGLNPVDLACAEGVDGQLDLGTLVERSPHGWASALISFKRLANRNVISL